LADKNPGSLLKQIAKRSTQIDFKFGFLQNVNLLSLRKSIDRRGKNFHLSKGNSVLTDWEKPENRTYPQEQNHA
jgi:hypothetical protein